MTLIHAFEKHLKKPCNYHLAELRLNAFIFFLNWAKEEVYRNKVRIIYFIVRLRMGKRHFRDNGSASFHYKGIFYKKKDKSTGLRKRRTCKWHWRHFDNRLGGLGPRPWLQYKRAQSIWLGIAFTWFILKSFLKYSRSNESYLIYDGSGSSHYNYPINKRGLSIWQLSLNGLS